jgi:hypothetical protein
MDYLENPPPTERQATPQDVNFGLELLLKDLLTQIKQELDKNHPTVLCMAVVQGGNNISDQNPKTISFQGAGKGVTSYKTILWTQSAKPVRASINGLSNALDGFTVTATPIIIDVPVGSVSIALGAAGNIGVNVPSSNNADGSVFVYGYTTLDELEV